MPPKLFIFFPIVFLYACQSKIETKTSNIAETTRPVQAEQVKKEVDDNREDTITIDDDIYLIGDSSKHPEKAISYVAIKFKPYIRFNDFPVDIYNAKKKASINYSSNATARQFKTVIGTTYKEEGLNFAGHYCFIEWGCGSPCQQSALVDLNTGIVYDGVDAALGYDYKKDSRMLIVNPVDPTGFYLNCPYCEPLIYIWNDKSKKFEQR